jgi:two-component system, cell cycle sensor histidine kinase and response regulator CckA
MRNAVSDAGEPIRAGDDDAARLQLIGAQAATFAHDLNNLLAAVTASAELALGRREIGPELRAELREIRNHAEHGAVLVRRFLAGGRRSVGRSSPIEIEWAIRTHATVLRRVLGAAIRLELTIEPVGLWVRLDEERLEQALLNLATNARDAMPLGGSFLLAARAVRLEATLESFPDAVPAGAYVVIAARDNGAGIAPEALGSVFKRFFTTKGELRGSGVGLCAVLDAVHEAQGFVTLASEEGRGTEVCLYLPRQATPGLADPVESATALVVDDEEPMRLHAVRVLRGHGWRVLSASSAEAAVRMVRGLVGSGGCPLDLLVTDVTLPGIDGPALLRTLRRTWPQLPALLVSGYAESTRPPDLEGVAMLGKPYQAADLAEAARLAASGRAVVGGE